jgi:ribosome recycling factor
MIDETLFDAEEKMERAVSVSRDDLSTIRTGRANPSMFSRIVIDYYGSATPITQLASINVPEARLVVRTRRVSSGPSRPRSANLSWGSIPPTTAH